MIRYLKYFSYAFWTLWRNKTRTILSTLWIIIGISSVTIMIAMWEWMRQRIIESMSLSNDVITITSENNYWWYMTNDGFDRPWEEIWYVQVKKVLNQNSIDKIKEIVPNVKYVIWYWESYAWNIKMDWRDIYSGITWITEDYLKAKNINIELWYWFNEDHYEKSEKVALIWSDVVRSYMNWFNPIWKKIMIWWYSYSIIWILEDTKDFKINYNIVLPYTTLKNNLWSDDMSGIEVYVQDILKIDKAKKDVLYLLYKLSEVESPDSVWFSIQSNDRILQEINKSIWQMQLFLWWIASIALLVWGIGIMNIMFVSVIERTREIGIRKAIWAKKLDIVFQFLRESVIISIIWLVIAVWLSYLWIYLIIKFVPNFTPIINVDILIFASIVSVSMGIIFGIIPAWKASRMKPIDALKFE